MLSRQDLDKLIDKMVKQYGDIETALLNLILSKVILIQLMKFINGKLIIQQTLTNWQQPPLLLLNIFKIVI